MRTLFSFLVALCLISTTLQPTAAQAPPALPDIMPEDLETQLALSALPTHLRDNAAVYLLSEKGYQKARNGTNGFSCLVRRHGAVPGAFSDAIAPVCYDQTGSETVMQAVLDEIAMLQAGKNPNDVATVISERWASNHYKTPSHGVSYMLSPVFRINGRDNFYVPHLMFYAPYKQDEAVGANKNRLDYVPFIQAPGLASAVMVVPVGEQEREQIKYNEADLLAKTEAYLKSRAQ